MGVGDEPFVLEPLPDTLMDLAAISRNVPFAE
jgi:hypothetical protein